MRFCDYIALGIILLCVVLAVFVLINRKKKGRGCSGNCGSCNGCRK